MNPEVFSIALCLIAEAANGHSAVRAELRPLEFLVGHCWTTTFPDGKTTDTHCFESALGGNLIQDHHVVRGGRGLYEGTTVYVWDPAEKKIVYTYCASDGGMSTGVAESGVAGEITFNETYRAEGMEMILRSVWTRRKEAGYGVVVTQKKDGEWQEAWRRDFQRSAPARASR